MASHRTRRRPSTVMVAGAAAGMTALLAFGHVADALAATLPGTTAVVGVGGKDDTLSARIPAKFGGDYVPIDGGFAGPADDRYFAVPYTASLPLDSSVAGARPALIEKVGDARETVGPDGTIYVVGYSEGSIVAEKYKRELDATGYHDIDTVKFVYIAAPTVPNGGIYARFPDLGPLGLIGFTSTGAAESSPYAETFITIEYDPVGDFPAYANPLSLANAAAGFLYLHGDPTPDAANLNDPNAVIVTQVDNDTYVLVKTEHLPLLQPIRDMSTALHTQAFTEPALGAIEPTLKLVVDMGYTDRDYSDPATPTRFSLITPPKRIVETLEKLPAALQQGADNVRGGLPSTSSGSTERVAPEKTPTTSDVKPTRRAPVQRRDQAHPPLSGIAKNVKDSPKPKRDAKPKTRRQSSAHKAA